METRQKLVKTSKVQDEEPENFTTILTSNADFQGLYKCVNLADPIDQDDAATKDYADNVQIADDQIADDRITNRMISGPVLGDRLVNASVSDSKIISLDYLKVDSLPTSYPSKTSLVTIDSNIACGGSYTMTGLPDPTSSSDIATKNYVDNLISTYYNAYAKVPIGTIVMWPSVTIPAKFLLCDGASFSPTTYPELNAVLGSANLPDFRGNFLRGYDPTNVRDPSSRSLLSLQADLFASHTHGVSGNVVANGRHRHSLTCHVEDIIDDGSTQDVVDWPPNTDYQRNTGSAGGHDHTFNVNSQSTGIQETRPFNINVNFIIKVVM